MRYFLILFFAVNSFILSAQSATKTVDKKAKEGFAFVKQNKMDTTVCILIDMSISSGKFRLFVYDFQKDSILLSGLCAHGSGITTPVDDKPVFSNVENSHCSSLGKYKIGARSYSSWGIHVNYALHGLETTNNNAYKRVVVLHSWEGINDVEIAPQRLAQSWGCPTVSNQMMEELDALLKTKKKPVLLWIFN